MSMLASLKNAQKQAPTNVVNADIQIVEMIDNKTVVVKDTTPQGPRERPRFRPVERDIPAEIEGALQHPAANGTGLHNNLDLVGDDIGLPQEQKKQPGRPGRPRLHTSGAAKQKAYRQRKKQNA